MENQCVNRENCKQTCRKAGNTKNLETQNKIGEASNNNVTLRA